MRGAPFGPRPAGWFVGLTLLAARLVETSGMGFLRLSFRLATATLAIIPAPFRVESDFALQYLFICRRCAFVPCSDV